MAPLFDVYIMVDWSAAARPVMGANSIWVCVLTRNSHSKLSIRTHNPSTRREARQLIQDVAIDEIANGKRVLIGFDFALGYPAGTAAALQLDTNTAPPWRVMHDFLATRVLEEKGNANNRFELAAAMNETMTGNAHPFWGAPASKAGPSLSVRKGDFSAAGSLPEHRLSEEWIRSHFHANPKSVWQLLGAGAVGSQSLLGIATVAYLREKLPGAALWPFETGFVALSQKHLESTPCILAEVYPSTLSITPYSEEILDQAQVRSLSERFESLDSAGILGGAFDLPDSISDGKIHKIIGEEGWILAK